MAFKYFTHLIALFTFIQQINFLYQTIMLKIAPVFTYDLRLYSLTTYNLRLNPVFTYDLQLTTYNLTLYSLTTYNLRLTTYDYIHLRLTTYDLRLNIMQTEELVNITWQVRRDIVRMVNGAKSGHPGGSLGCTDFMVALYFEIMEHKTNFSMDGIGEDIFFLSNGHISPLFYSVLARSGYFPVEELATFRKLNSRLQGHPATHEHLPGIRVASGSLGQGLSVSVGAAMSKKLNGDTHLVYTLCGDGEMQEGQNWEAIMFAAKQKVDNLIVTIDVNGQQIDGTTKSIMGDFPLSAKFLAFGWDVYSMDGHNMEDIVNTINKVKLETGKGKPIAIMMHTEMGQGVDFMMGSHKWHGIAPNDDELAKALAMLPSTFQDY
jgi:transketolase